jgi:hypothetical protein
MVFVCVAVLYYDDPRFADHARAAVPWIGAAVAFGWVARSVHRRVADAAHVRRLEALQGFADRLADGRLEGRGFRSGAAAEVTGSLDGREVRLSANRGVGEIVHDVRASMEVDQLHVEAIGLARLAARLGISPVDAKPEVASVVTRLVADHGFHRITVEPGLVRAERAYSGSALEPGVLLDAFRGLARLARLRERPGSRDVLQGSRVTRKAGSARCPFCHDALSNGALTVCSACGAPHHSECWKEMGGCSVMGCAQQARS